MEFDFTVYTPDYQRIELDSTIIAAPWWPRWLAACNKAARESGGDVDAASRIQTWISNHPAFEEVVYKDFWVPASPWKRESEKVIRHGEAMRDDILVRVAIYSISYARAETALAVLFEVRPTTFARQWPVRRSGFPTRNKRRKGATRSFVSNVYSPSACLCSEKAELVYILAALSYPSHLALRLAPN